MTDTPARSAADFGAPLLIAWLLGICVTFNGGAYQNDALFFLVLALAVAAWRFGALLVDAHAEPTSPRSVLPLVWIALFGAVFFQFNDPVPLQHAHGPWRLGPVTQVGALLLLLSYLPFLDGRRADSTAMRTFRFFGFAALLVIGGVDIIRTSPNPLIDVWTVQNDGARALLHGQNPYVVVSSAWTGPPPALPCPFVYTPLQLFVSTASYAILGDVRYALLAAVFVAGVAFRSLAKPSNRGALEVDAPALMLWLWPKLPMILEKAWTDPVPLALVALAVVARARARSLLYATLLGLAVTSKPTTVFLIPLAAFLLPLRRRDWIFFGTAAALPLLPFALWNFPALFYATITFQTQLPPRDDGLTLVTWMNRTFEAGWTGNAAFLLVALVIGAALIRLRRTTSSFAFALSATAAYLIFFAFNKWAFANYYFFVAGLSALAAAV